MNRSSLVFFPVLGLVVAAVGCSGKGEVFKAELGSVRTQTHAKLDSLKKQNEDMNKRLNEMNARVDQITLSNERLVTDLAAYATRPDSIRAEILAEAANRFTYLAKRQQEFEATVDTVFVTKSKAIADTLDLRLADMDKTLAQYSSFVRFVASEQDSINRVFANRFDSRPWYQSIMGKWDDAERARTQTP